ncbi:MAG: glycine zipper family protein [Flavobacteriaceae bacterium]
MRRITFLFASIFMFAFSGNLSAQETATVTKTQEVTLQIPADISKTLGVFVFPAKEQDDATQKEDQKQCYIWAYNQTNFDPQNPTKVQAKQVESGPTGAAVAGAAKGAAAGAAIGAVTGDAGDGAAIGAIAGTMRGRRAAKQAKAQQQAANNKAASDAQAKMLTDFKKAFSACIEAKGYTVN